MSYLEQYEEYVAECDEAGIAPWPFDDWWDIVRDA